MDNKKYIIAGGVVALLAIVICLLFVFLGGGNNGDDTDQNDEQDEQVTGPILSGEDSDVSGTGIYGITDETMLFAINNIQNLRDNFNVATTSSRYLEKAEDGKYILSTVYNAECIPTSTQAVVGSDFTLQVTMEYKGENKYPSNLTITVNYTDDNDINIASEFAYALVNSIVNSEVGSHMQNCTFGGSATTAYEVGDNTQVLVSKMAEDFTDEVGYKVASFIVEITQGNSEGYYSSIDAFTPDDNPGFVFYKSGLLEYGASMSDNQTRLAFLFSDGATVEADNLTDYTVSDETGNLAQAYGHWTAYEDGVEIGVLEAGATETTAPISVAEGVTPKTPSNYFYINYTGKTFDNEIDAFYNTEDVLVALTGKEVELQDYIGQSSWELTLNESGLNESWGYPVTLSFNRVSTDDSSYRLSIRIESVNA